ncbi:carbonic anhydrase [Xylogone sp. PMI_703]|nr:carbonic anhydrase [Xylogone sp. PMI_703]
MAGTYVLTPYTPYNFDEKNKDYSENIFPVPDPVVGDRSRTGILTCSDPRCTPEHIFKLKEQEAFAIRNEGGRAADPGVIRTVTLIDALAFTAKDWVREVMVVHHTDCSALHYSDNLILNIIAQNDPNAPGGPFKQDAYAYAEAMAYIPFPDGETERERLEKSVKQDVMFLRTHPLWKPHTKVSGWIYDLKTGVAEKLDL